MSAGRWHHDITRTQWLVLAGTTLGWGLDGFAGSLYVLVLGPAMTELLPHSGIGVDGAAIGFYGGMTVALFLAGWATGGILFGMLADYFGRTGCSRSAFSPMRCSVPWRSSPIPGGSWAC